MKLGEPGPVQMAALAAPVRRLNVWDGAIRAGKTVGSLLKWSHRILEAPPGNLAAIGKTERTLKRNVFDPLQEMFPKSVRFVAGSGEAWVFGRRVYIGGANDKRAVDKIKGLTLLQLYGDQVETWPEEVFRMGMSRLSEPRAEFHGTLNPEGPRHWFKVGYIDPRGSLDMSYFHFRLDDNPHLTEEFKANLRRENPGLWGKRYIDGLWVAAEGAIFDMLEEERFIVGGELCPVEKVPKMRGYWLGVDYGTANPFVAVLVGEGHDDRLYVLDELRWDSRKEHVTKTDAAYSEMLGEFLGRIGLRDQYGYLYDRITVDASAASFITQLWADGWEHVSRAPTVEVRHGIRFLRSLMGAGRLFFGPRMRGSVGLDEMLGYVWDPKAQQRGEDAPLKENDHFPDALRYGVLGCRHVWREWITADVDVGEMA